MTCIYSIRKISSRFSRVNIFVLMFRKLVHTSTSIYMKLNGQFYLICIEIIYVARIFNKKEYFQEFRERELVSFCIFLLV